ncbi:mechanosensitive ion channel domain-containing protein [Aliiroseovarius sp. F20344]|uniref:mechanosensitive ion channel family protein n=1 Tax=Aliiroseovarius sp. F20344 TaxID=2926414 RepID=UPI001FF3BC42|nr:mechanosensitive ion channel domain-containing protein [Aliiroseovarius sp. F20344]MCK0141514.1 mechanosensitive ion channel [Aliiroseovarius sp. F20344]
MEQDPAAEVKPEAPAETPGQNLTEQLKSLWEDGGDFILSLGQTWRLYQVLIMLGLVAAAFIASRLLRPKVEDWLRAREGWSKRKLRFAIHLRNRIAMMIYIVLSWGTVSVMREVTWPSRSYLIALVATIVTAWLLVGLAAFVIENRPIRRMAMWGMWIYVTLYFLGITQETASVLDNLALEVGDFRISLWTVLRVVVILGILFALARMFSRGTAARIQENEDISPSMKVLAVKFLQMGLYGAAFFIALKAVGVDLTGLAFLSGAIGLGLGFGLQKVVSNLVSGVIILLDKSIKPGDVISLGDTFGWIEQLGARYVSVVTRDGREYLIPNEDLITGQVVNWSHTNAFVRLDIFFGTAYDDDPHQVRRIAIEAARSVDRVLSFRPPVCHIVGFGDSSVDYILRFWIDDPSGGLTNIRGNVYLALWDAFQENGISIPFPQREVRMLEDAGPKIDP